MSNEFKKKDAKGNKLPEEIGKGINREHLEKVLKERIKLDSIITLKINAVDKKNFEKACGEDLNPSIVIRAMIKEFTKNN